MTSVGNTAIVENPAPVKDTQTVKIPATVNETFEEQARDQPKNSAVNAEYPLRSNDKTLYKEAHHRCCQKHHSQ
jgi:hypothetical protein